MSNLESNNNNANENNCVADGSASEFECVIGLEIHAQLSTKSKAFCSCSNDFGSDVNKNVCPVCTGQPGALPVLNKSAVEYAVKMALATNCQIALESIFARKNYFYPDLPKGYQISQFDKPLAEHGKVSYVVKENNEEVEKTCGITRIHMEEDAGKSTHLDTCSIINFNRSSTPLIEIVSEPDIRSPAEAVAYLQKLRTILVYLEICDGNMEEGNFRCDANLSIRPKGQKTLGTKTEVKNINSFRFVEKALHFEMERQIKDVKAGNKIIQETRFFDASKGETISMRSKEQSHDYRYFPEPDLMPLVIEKSWIEAVKKTLPELPDEKVKRFINEYQIPKYDAEVLSSSKILAKYYEDTLKAQQDKFRDPKIVSNWIMAELLRLVNEHNEEISKIKITPQLFAELIDKIKEGVISGKIAKTIIEDMYATGERASIIIEKKGLVQVSDESAIEKIVDQVIANSQKQLADYKAGKQQLFGFFVGQVMKEMKGKGNPGIINEILKRRIG